MSSDVASTVLDPSNGSADARTEPVAIGPDVPAATAIQAALTRGYLRLRACEPDARRGDVEGVHRMRASTRRLRSELRAFRTLIVAEWGDVLQEDLKWLSGVLGAVRDLDVLRARFQESAGSSLESLAPLFRSLDERHCAASQEFQNALQSERYPELLVRLDAAAVLPAFQEDAWGPCETTLPKLVAHDWHVLSERARALGPDDPDPAYHEVRKRAKRVRYTTEAVANALSHRRRRQAREFARLATHVQDVLGEHQDAVVAAGEIERIAGEYPSDGRFNLAAGRLLERQYHIAEISRAAFFEAWDTLDRKKNRRWFKT